MSWRGSLSRNLQELRIHFCQTSPSSLGMRTFVRNNYPDLKMKNPGLPILVREAQGVEPALWARYGFGKEKSAKVSNLDEEAIMDELKELFEAGARDGLNNSDEFLEKRSSVSS